MYPILFIIPVLNLPVFAYGAMLGLSFVVPMIFIPYLDRQIGNDPDIHWIGIIIGIFTALVGARLFFVLGNMNRPWTLQTIIHIQSGGLVAYGGYIAGALGAGTYFWAKRVNVWRLMDTSAPFMALGLGLVRIGCFLNGCCFGKPTDSVFGVCFPPRSVAFKQHIRSGLLQADSPYTITIHPTQLYESFVGFILTSVLLWMYFRRKKELKVKGGGPGIRPLIRRDGKDGHIFWVFALLYSAWRFFIEFIRDDYGRSLIPGVLTQSQFIALILIPLAIYMIFLRHSRHPDTP